MTSQSLLLATRNDGKLTEFRQLLGNLPLSLCDLIDFPDVETVPETGESFIDNASLKAAGYAKQRGLLTLADDSGLAVDALSGAPGVQSARCAGLGASDHDRVNRLLSDLAGIATNQRTATFVCAIAIANEQGQLINVSVGECSGHIAFAPRGANGFGYDPIFVPTGFDRTFAQMTSDVKNRISHRALALAKAIKFLRSLTDTSARR